MPRIRQTSKYGINPCPSATDAQVLKLAKVERVKRAATGQGSQPFCVRFQFSGGHDREMFMVDPAAEPLQLRGDGEWRAFEQTCKEQGCVLVVDPTDPEEVYEAKRDGLQRAIQFWTERGLERAYDTQLRQGWNEDQFARQRGNLWIYYYNQVRAELCEKELERLEGGGDPLVNGTVNDDGEIDGASPTDVDEHSGRHSSASA